MTKRKKVLLIGFSILAVVFCMATLWFLFPEWSYINSDIEKVYCKATIDEDFSDDSLMVLMTSEASLAKIGYEFTPADFAEIGCVDVHNYTWRVPADTTLYHRMLCLKLKYPSKLNVLIAIKILEHRDDVYSAEPNYVIKMID